MGKRDIPNGDVRWGALAAWLIATAVFLAPRPALPQPVTERSPNLEGTWITSHRNLHFTFSHRFEVVGADVDVTDVFGDAKIVNYPTFALTYGILDKANLGFRYSSNSTVAGGPNEWQPYVKWSPLPASGGRGLSLSAIAAWNGAAGSLDGELGGQADLGRLELLGVIRGFSETFDSGSGSGKSAVAIGGGALVRLSRHLSVAADVTEIVTGAEGETAWSAGLQVGIPYTPHTLSLLATNVTSGTLQGSANGAPGAVFWGFEFTVPFSGIARWGRVFDPLSDQAGDPRAVVDAEGRAIVEIDISAFSYGGPRMSVPVGTTVRWVNRDPVGHTVTPDDGAWGSRLIGPGEVFEHTFSEPGEYPYHCIPHPNMRSSVLVTPGSSGAGDAKPKGR